MGGAFGNVGTAILNSRGRDDGKSSVRGVVEALKLSRRAQRRVASWYACFRWLKVRNKTLKYYRNAIRDGLTR